LVQVDNLISIRNIEKIYQMGDIEVPALRGVNLEIERGEFVAVMGASGSGKSTFMNIVGCLDRSTRGSYFLEGHEVGSLSPDEWAYIRNHKIGFVFQGFNLLPRTTALENVELPMMYNGLHGKGRRQRALEVLSLVGLEKRRDHMPSQLSGGQQQRVAIARSLVNRPALILADEPTGNLDTENTAAIAALFASLAESHGKTVIMASHDPKAVEQFKKIYHMRDGKFVN
jgi:putative ABC transport system ATP-binding protein